MRRSLLLIAGLLFTSIAIQSQGNVAAQYPLRIHIFDRHETRFYNSTHTIRETRGEGRANLYEGGTPRGVNFSFDCGDAFHSNIGYETYPAWWKKANSELTVLLPVIGKSGQYYSCTFNTDVKEVSYAKHDKTIEEDPVDTQREWMAAHNYDPEHGKETPTLGANHDTGDPVR